MTNKAEKSVAVAVIKWTDEEWKAIARQLHASMGSVLLESERLEEVKAKDVFTAQEKALPEHRHRKLISISQGFQAIRQKLKNILSETLTEPPALSGTQEQLFTPTAASAPNSDEETIGNAPISASDLRSHSKHAYPATPHPASTVAPDNVEHGPDGSPVPVPESGSVSDAAMTAKADEERAATRDFGAGTATVVRPHSAASPVTQNSRPAAASHGVRHDETHAEPEAGATGANLVEIARPFVAMVCQELARALIDALAQSKGSDSLSALVQQAMVQTVSGQQPPPARADVKPMPHNADEDDSGVAESEVQPLFDPKLPPSASSSFKPTVGVVGANAHDFDELQQMYPQLLLTAVAVDDVPHANSLRQCQRIIGLREDVPAKTDEILRRIFRNRYLRLTGGMERVREQLDAWLDKPGSIDPGRPTARKPRKPGNGPKKRHGNYPPRTPR